MNFDLTLDVDISRIRAQVEYLIRKRSKNVDVIAKRTNPQNNYLHLILGWYAAQTGNTKKYVKEKYYKQLVNPELFIIEKDDKFLGKTQELRSSAELTTEEMNLSIERFRNWSAQEGDGIYLPAPNEDKFLEYINVELKKYKQWI
jgi:hypothetical protein